MLEAVGRRFGIDFSWHHFDWSCQTYLKTSDLGEAIAHEVSVAAEKT